MDQANRLLLDWKEYIRTVFTKVSRAVHLLKYAKCLLPKETNSNFDAPSIDLIEGLVWKTVSELETYDSKSVALKSLN